MGTKFVTSPTGHQQYDVAKGMGNVVITNFDPAEDTIAATGSKFLKYQVVDYDGNGIPDLALMFSGGTYILEDCLLAEVAQVPNPWAPAAHVNADFWFII